MQEADSDLATQETIESLPTTDAESPASRVQLQSISRARVLKVRTDAFAGFVLFAIIWSAIAWWTRTEDSSKQAPMAQEFVIDLNQATVAELNLLPGVGPKLAQEILDYREQHGGFQSVDDLMHIRGIKGGRMLALKKYVNVSPSERR